MLSVSIIIPVYKSGEKFRKCLASVAAVVKAPHEIIVVSDGADDDSWKDAEELAVQVVRLRNNGGPGRARNFGAKAAKGGILFFVDSDVTVPPDAVDLVAAAFQEEPEVAAIIGSYDEQPAEGNFLSQYKNLFHHYVHQQGDSSASTFWGACGAIRREVFFEMDGFDERYVVPSIEDIEFGYRLKAGGHKIKLIKNLQIKHLKRWGVLSLITTDFHLRAVPWTRLLLRNREFKNDLNLGLRYRLSLLCTLLFIASLIGSMFSTYFLLGVVFFFACFLILNRSLFGYFYEKRGRRFTAVTAVWRLIYDLYSAAGFVCGVSLHVSENYHRNLLREGLAMFDSVALGTAFGTLNAFLIWGATTLLVLKGGDVVGPHLELLSQYFPGYSVSSPGALIGACYGFFSGFAFGYVFAVLRNFLLRIYIAFLRLQIGISDIQDNLG